MNDSVRHPLASHAAASATTVNDRGAGADPQRAWMHGAHMRWRPSGA